MTRGITVVSTCGALVLGVACHSRSTNLASVPVPAAECAGVVAPVPGDSDFKRLAPPLLHLPLPGPVVRASADQPPAGADVRVNASGEVDSVIIDRIAAPVEENSLRRALMRAKAMPAQFKGCPVTAWTVYVGTK